MVSALTRLCDHCHCPLPAHAVPQGHRTLSQSARFPEPPATAAASPLSVSVGFSVPHVPCARKHACGLPAGLLSLSVTFPRPARPRWDLCGLLHAAVEPGPCLTAEQHWVPWAGPSRLLVSRGTPGLFLPSATLSSAAVHVCVLVLVGTCFQFSWVCVSRSGIARSYGDSTELSEELPNRSIQWLCLTFTLSPARCEGPTYHMLANTRFPFKTLDPS